MYNKLSNRDEAKSKIESKQYFFINKNFVHKCPNMTSHPKNCNKHFDI